MTETQERTGLRVECYEGYRANQEPVRFFLGSREYVVEEILDRWLDPDYRFFKLRVDDGGVYILCYDERDESWSLTLYDSGRHPPTRLSST